MNISSDSGSDDPTVTDWNKELISAICQREGESEMDPEKYRLYRVKTCLAEKADVNSIHGKNRDTILHMAIKRNYQRIVEFLVEHGAKTDITNRKGYTAITLAESLGNQAVGSILKRPKRQFKPAIHLSIASEPQPMDDQQPSTSRETTFPYKVISSVQDINIQSLNSDRDLLGAKRKPTSDCEDHESNKKLRLDVQNVRPSVSQPGYAGNVDSVSTPRARSNPDEDQGGMIQNQISRFDRKMTYTAGGLKSSFHGVVYQLKHLGFTLLRAMQPNQEISFLLSTERVDVGKFDDLVLEYINNQGKDVDLFLQLKHSRNVCRQVNAYDLLEKEDGDFFVPKYFISWREIKKSSLFSDNVSKNVVLGTNISVNLEGLRNAEISWEEILKPVECLEMIGIKEETTCYKLTANVQSNRKLYDKLKETSDIYVLARELVEHVLQRKKITLVGMFKQYHVALGEQVIDTENKTFLQSFIKNKNLPQKTKDFRKIFFLEFSKLRGRLSKREVPEHVIWKEVEDSSLELSKNFGEKFQLPVGPQLTDIPVFSQELIKLFNNATADNVVKISKNIYRKNAKKGSVERVVADNIDKLAGHVLITKCGKIKFRSQFFDDTIQSSGNIEEFKDILKLKLGSKFDELQRLDIEINNFDTCEEEQLDQNSELPDGEMAEADITEFLNVFILAVNLPDEGELGEMITREIGDDSNFNLLDSDLIGRTFLTKIVDWFKEKGEKIGEGKYLSYKGGKVFFKEMEDQINTLKSMGVTSVYWEELKEYDIDFDCENTRVKNFLSENELNPTSHRILILMAPKESLLTALRVCQILGRMEKYAKNDSFIFIRLQTLSLRGIKDQVVRAFQSQHCHHLLVIECDEASMNRYPYGLWFSICKAIENVGNPTKKVILIIRGDKDLAKSLSEQFQSVCTTHIQEDDDINFDHLTEYAQKKLLEKQIVNFQGHGDRISFRKLLDIEDLDNIGVDKIKDIVEMIDSSTLVELIRDDGEIRIGNDLERLGEIGDYYITRTIVRRIFIKEDIFKGRQIPDLFAISGIDKELQAELGRKEETPPMARNIKTVTILNSEQEVEQFKALCEKNTQRNLHWLKEEAGKYIWKQSIGNITYLLQHRDESVNYDNNDRTGETHLNEDHFATFDGPVIISDIAGMGKSTMLTYLAGIIKKNEPDLLVLKIDLNRHTTALAEVKKNMNYNLRITNDAVEFLVSKLLNLRTHLEMKVFKLIIEKRDKVALILDGFDEISPLYENIVIDLIETLAKYRMRKLFVATRPHTRRALENKLNTFSYELQPFSVVNQEDFLKKFWKKRLGVDNSDQRKEYRMRKYAIAIMKKLANSIRDRMNKFTGIPIQTKLVAEICQNLSEESQRDFDLFDEDSTDNQPTLLEKIDLLYLYEHFVDMKFDVFFKKRGGNLEDPAVIEGRQLRYDAFIDAHEKLALDVLFDEDKVKALLPSRRNVKREADIVQERTGIITQFINGKPHFGHRTYAEYFAAKFLSDKLKEGYHNESVRKIFVTNIFLEENYENLRAFMNCLLSDEHNNSFEDQAWKSHLIENRNSMNRTIFHVAAAEGNELFIRLFLNCLSTNPVDRKVLIDIEDDNGRTAVYWAARYGYSKELKLLIEDGNGQVDSRSKTDGETPLYAAALIGKLVVVKYLLDKGANVNSHTNDGQTPLHAATLSGQLDIVKYLLEKEANVNSQTNNGNTPLFLATFTRKLEIIAHLLEKRANINSRTKDGIMPLHMAAYTGNLDVVKYLLDKKAEVDAQTNDGRTPFYVAATTGKLDVMKYLLDNKANIISKTNNGQTPLHVAAAAGQLNVVEYLLDKRIAVDIQSNDGRTPLYIAAATGKLDVVKYLIDKKANVLSQTNDGETPLYVAAVAGELAVVKYLIDVEANLQFQTNNGWTPLHAAAFMGHLDVVKYSLENNADVNFRTNDGDTPLHVAAFRGELEVVKCLLDKEAEVDCRTNDGRTPLNGAAFAGELDVVKYLLDKKAKIEAQTNDGQTPLHVAAFSGKLDVVKYLLEKKANVNSQANDGETPLHKASLAGHLNVVKYLLDQKADVNSQTNDGRTPVYAATVGCKLDVVKYLLDNKADNNLQTNDGITPLHAAAFTGQLDIIKYLVYKNANVNSQTKDSKTPLHIAAFNGKLDIVKYLLDNGANVNSQTSQGDTPLHVAAVAGHLDVVKYLIDKKANINSQANDGQKPVHLAISTGKFEVVKYFLDKDAKANS